MDGCLSDIVKKGFDEELLDAMLSRQLLNYSVITEQQHLGVNLSVSLSLMWANHDDLDYYSDMVGTQEPWTNWAPATTKAWQRNTY